MSQKKASPAPLRNDILRERLEYLYSRRVAVDNLIRSLEIYTECADPLVVRGAVRPNTGIGVRSRLSA